MHIVTKCLTTYVTCSWSVAYGMLILPVVGPSSSSSSSSSRRRRRLVGSNNSMSIRPRWFVWPIVTLWHRLQIVCELSDLGCQASLAYGTSNFQAPLYTQTVSVSNQKTCAPPPGKISHAALVSPFYSFVNLLLVVCPPPSSPASSAAPQLPVLHGRRHEAVSSVASREDVVWLQILMNIYSQTVLLDYLRCRHDVTSHTEQWICWVVSIHLLIASAAAASCASLKWCGIGELRRTQKIMHEATVLGSQWQGMIWTFTSVCWRAWIRLEDIYSILVTLVIVT